MNRVKPVHVGAVLYVSIAVFLAAEAFFGRDEAYKYVSPYVLFWLKGFCVIGGAGAGALKMYMSRDYADYRDSKDAHDSPPKP